MTSDPVPAPFNLAAYVLRHCELSPDKTALSVVTGGASLDLTYGQLGTAVRGAATGLLRSGLKAGDRVLLRLGNTADFPIAFLACIAVDLVPVPTSAQLTAVEITSLARDLAPRAIIAAKGVALPDHPAPVIDVDRLASFATLPPAPFATGDPNREAYIIFTSGTSGKARGVIHAHRAIWARRMMRDGWYAMTPQDRILHAGAFNWTYTLGTGLLDPWSIGATALIPAPDVTSNDLWSLIGEHKATLFAAAPGIYRQMLKSNLSPVPDLRHGLSAGEKLPDTTRSAWETATKTSIFEAYGMSECSTFISANPDAPAETGTLGRPQFTRRIALLDDTGVTCDHGQIAVHRSDHGLMLGYHNADQGAHLSGEWFLTGDIGTRTKTGDIRYEGRVDDMMNAGGYRVSPIEVEQALTRHPAIQDAAAVQVQVKQDASVIAAFYVAPNVIDEAGLLAHCARHLARYKTPRLFILCDSLPRGPNNKLLRAKLRQDWERRNGQT